MMLHIIYRHTNHSGFGKNRPQWWSYDKSLNNILSTIEGLDFVKFHLLFDGDCQIADPRIDYIECFKGGSDWASYRYCWNYAKNLPLDSDDIIYFAENDYAFVPGWPQKVLELFNTYTDLDYVTVYDCPDKYDSRAYPGLTTHLFLTKTHHWRLAPSTTGSVIVSKRILNEDFDIHTTDPSDYNRFETLRNIKQRNLLSPIPSLATHCEVEWLAPIVDWEGLSKNY